ncbi:major facilitator superfamily domain-containing protein [Mycena haematopus]|nr:major facilitator superfamily domain-containing protein [Mycena haematopus]
MSLTEKTLTSSPQTIDPPDPTSIPEAPENDFPHGFKLVILMIALSLSVFLVALDNTIIATAIPKITDQFKSLDDVGWAISATQLLFGKFYTFLPIKSVFLSSISLFELGSLVCGVAPSSIALIIGRTIAGLGSRVDVEISAAHSVPLAKRPMYTGIIGAMYGVASVAGPIMAKALTHISIFSGGVFTDKVSWRCGASEQTEIPLTFGQRIAQFDPWGTLAFIPAIVCLLLALQWGGSKYAWNSSRIIALFVISGVFIVAFIVIQVWKQESATVPPRIFRKRSIWAGGLFSLCIGASFFIFVFYLPIWFQAIKGTSAVNADLRSDTLPMILSMVLASLVAGSLTTVLGYYTPFILLSALFMTTNTGHSHWIGYQIIFGFGFGMGMQAPLIAAQTVLELKDIPVGTTINNFLQSLVRFDFWPHLPCPGVSADIIFKAGATNLQNIIDPQSLSAVLEVYNNALVAAFQVGIAMAGISFLGGAVMEWKSVKEKNIEMTFN